MSEVQTVQRRSWSSHDTHTLVGLWRSRAKRLEQLAQAARLKVRLMEAGGE